MKIIEANKAEVLFKLLIAQINKDLECGENVILIVPAQASLSVEKAVFDALGKPGFFKLRIMRGRKLHEEILHECGYPGLVPINTIGRSMILRKVTDDCKEKLTAFSSVCLDSGFIDMAGDFIVQLKQNNVAKDQLDALIDSYAEGSLVKKKLQDMRLIAGAYGQALENKFTDSEDLLDYITIRVKDCKLIKNSKIYYYGFYSFTKREYGYLKELENCSKGLSIALLTGKEACFEITRKTEARLMSSSPNSEMIKVDDAEDAVDTNPRLRLVRCANPFIQAKTIAVDIRRLIREQGYHYSDIAVLTSDSGQMTGSLERAFEQLNIPVFEDEKRSILHTKAADGVLALLSLAFDNYETQDIIRVLKSGILNFDREDVESFENYAKQYHIKAARFFEPFKYGQTRFESFGKIEKLRAEASDKLRKFTDGICECKTVKNKSEFLYRYLEDELKFSEILETLSQTQADEGFTDASEESSRVWDSICSILDQFTELMGEEMLSLEEYFDILKNAFEDIKVGVLPQSEGRVQLGSILRSFADDKKAVYIAGFNDGFIPSDAQSNGILSDDELIAAAEKGAMLAKTSDAYSDEESYMIHKAMASAKEYLWLGYCVSDADGSDIKASTMLDEIKSEHPQLCEENDISACSDGSAYIEGRDLAASEMGVNLREAMGGAALLPVWKEVYNNIKDDAVSVKEALRFTNRKTAVGKDLAKSLFAKDGEFSFSPSRMDGFASCPFKHFVSYGLNPDIPKEFGMGGSEVGSIYHEALLMLCQRITDWTEADDNMLEKHIDEILKELSLTRLDGVMLSGKAEIYTSKRIRQVCLRFAKHMAQQIRDSKIEKMYLETSFGRNGVFPPIVLNTSGGKVYIEGRIDRVDICPDGEGKYVRVIDYKSGNVKFNKSLVQKGLSLQLMVYLEGVMGEYSNPSKSGVYYFCIKDPKVAASIQDLPADEISSELMEKINKEYRLDGMDVDSEFRLQFTETLNKLCERLTLGDISVDPRKIGNIYDSCAYCEFAGICLKDIK